MKRLLTLLSLVLMLSIASVAYYAFVPLSLPSNPFEFTLKQGSSLKSTAREMQQSGLLEHDWQFVWLARLLGKSGQLKAGNYSLEHPVSPLQLLKIISSGEVSLSQISLIEGWTFKQMRDALNADPDITHDTIKLSDAEIMQRIGATEDHPEGLFFPNTYYFAAGSSDLKIMKRAYQTMQNHLQKEWVARAAGSAIPGALSGPDTGFHYREGNRNSQRPRHDRRRVCEPPEEGHDAAIRSNGNIWLGRQV